MVKPVASAGTADPSKEGFGRDGQARFNTPLAHPAGWAGGLDRRAEPPPAHSIGRVGEDDMGRSGQFVKPCWLVAGGVALVVRNW